MPIKSRFHSTVPRCSVQQWIFGSVDGPLPEKRAYVDAEAPDTHYLTYVQLRLLAKRVAAGLTDYGLQPGDRVLLFSGNHLYYPALVMGIWMAGCIFTGANPAYTPRELGHQLGDSGSSLLIASDQGLHVALEAVALVGLPKDRLFAFDGLLSDASAPALYQSLGISHWTDLVADAHRGNGFQWVEPEYPEETTCSLNYSSGTTGMPKGVEITHRNHVSNGVGTVFMSRLDPTYAGDLQRAKALCLIPMFHAFSQGFYLCSLVHEQIPIYVMSGFDFARMLVHVEAFRITHLMAVPPVFNAIASHPLARQTDWSSLKLLGSGAAPLSTSTRAGVNKVVSSSTTCLRQGWGMTEVTCTALAWDVRRKHEAGGVGELLPDCEAKLVWPETDLEVTTPRTPGELWIHSASVMRGYWKNPAATAETVVRDDNGKAWLRTGDLAMVESYEEGAIFHVVGRLKELIKVRGYQVAPAELESLLLERADIADAAVVGIPMEDEEIPLAYVVRSPSSEVSSQAIGDWIAQRVVHYKRLRGGVVFVEHIPRNPSGKILRRVLAAQAKRQMEIRPRL